jgi:hypothetical protein
MSIRVYAGKLGAVGGRVNAFWAIGRHIVPIAGIALLAYGSVTVARDGLSALFVQNSVDESSMASANNAALLNILNPDAYHARAMLYQRSGQTMEATRDLERAVELRPNDHYLWLELGYERYQNRDLDGAIGDFKESARLAPFYAQPHWYLGNILVQSGQTEEGFAEIRQAFASDPSYLSEAIELADEAYGSDPVTLVHALQPQNSATRLVLARYFLKHNNRPAALALFTEAGVDISSGDRRTLLADFLVARRFSEAHELWLADNPQVDDGGNVTALITDGGFENEIDPGAPGFEWHVSPNLQRVAAAHDQDHPQSGSFCLRLDFNGASSPETAIVSQILIAEPTTHYQLNFVFRTRQLVTGGAPVVVIIDASNGQLLGQSKPLPQNQGEWLNDSIPFLTPATNAVMIVIQREKCSLSPCPAFGYAWFDSFDLRKL